MHITYIRLLCFFLFNLLMLNLSIFFASSYPISYLLGLFLLMFYWTRSKIFRANFGDVLHQFFSIHQYKDVLISLSDCSNSEFRMCFLFMRLYRYNLCENHSQEYVMYIAISIFNNIQYTYFRYPREILIHRSLWSG